MKRKKDYFYTKILFLFLLILICSIGILYFSFSQNSKVVASDEVHYHADFKLYLNGKFYNFTQDKYMTDDNKTLSKRVHLHDMDGEVIHYHDSGVSLDYFFSSLNITSDGSCITKHEVEYCSDGERQWVMVVNGEITPFNLNYIAQDLDRILLAYVSLDENILELYEDVTDRACIQSGLCPERGEAYDESSCGPTSCSYSIE